MSTISGWVGTGAGLITIAACLILAGFVHYLPKFSHPWLHRGLIIAAYCGATAVIVTTIGQFIIRMVEDAAGLLGGFSSGIGFAAITLAGLFLLLTVLVAVIKVPVPGMMVLAVGLAFTLALVPGGFLHDFYAETAIPGQQLAGQIASWLGG